MLIKAQLLEIGDQQSLYKTYRIPWKSESPSYIKGILVVVKIFCYDFKIETK